MTQISVVIPAFNEAERIQDCLRETALALQAMDYEIVIVDDGSQDATWQEVQTFAQHNSRVRAIRQPNNQGKGAAVLRGCQAAQGEMIAFLDADLELHPAQLLTLIQAMQDSQADIVIGSKKHIESQLDYPWSRRVASDFYYRLVRFLFGLNLHDTQTGLKLFRARVLRRIMPRLKVRHFAFDLELLVAASRCGYQIVEVPVVVEFQREHGGRIGLLAVAHMIVDTLRIFYQASFWKWLKPGLAAKLWMLAFVSGLVMASFGFAHWLTLHIPIPGELSDVSCILTLRFVDTRLRDWLMIGVGLALVVWALVELNKILLAAFARIDDGDLAGIVRRGQPKNNEERDE